MDSKTGDKPRSVGKPTPEVDERTGEVPPATTEAPAASEPEIPPKEIPPVQDWERNYRYLLADFDNFRKRVDREKDQAVRVAVGRLLLRIVDLHTGIDEARATLPKEAQVVKDGLELVMKNLEALLRDEKLQPVASIGDPFSPVLHEAVGSMPLAKGAKEDTIGHVVQQGYSLDSAILRPAKVLVFRSPPPSSENDSD